MRLVAVAVVLAADVWNLHDLASWRKLDRPEVGCALGERAVSVRVMVRGGRTARCLQKVTVDNRWVVGRRLHDGPTPEIDECSMAWSSSARAPPHAWRTEGWGRRRPATFSAPRPILSRRESPVNESGHLVILID